MIELKAELLKKQKELSSSARIEKKPSKRPLTKHNDPQIKRPKSSIEPVDEDVLEASKRALEAKAHLYRQLESGTLDERDLSPAQREALMVDFTWKGWNPETGDYELPENDSEIEQMSLNISNTRELTLEEALALPASCKDDWIQFKDEFGRSRAMKCSELHQLYAERQEATQLLQRYRGDAELRNKGVGFYTFAPNEQERTEQMAALRKLRAETLESRTRALLMREQRRLQLERRLRSLKKV